MSTEGKCKSIVLSTLLCLVCFCMMVFWLLIVVFRGEFDDIFLTKDFGESGLGKVVGILTTF